MIVDSSKFFALAGQSTNFFHVLTGFRNKYEIDFTDILIFLALGRLNFDDSTDLMFMKPANIVSVSGFLGIPRETLRRKLNLLETRDLVQRSNYGFVVKDLAAWRKLAESICKDAMADRVDDSDMAPIAGSHSHNSVS
jgi:predicted transcriptional regulator